MNKKYIIGAIVLVLAIGAAIVLKNPQGGNTPAVSPTPDTRTKEEIYQSYLKEGQDYGAKGFQGDSSAFYKAIDAYKKAVEVSESKVWVPFYNLGNTYRLVKDYKSAEDAYNKALEISSGEWLVYLKKIEMYRYETGKPEADIVAVYNEAVNKTGGDNYINAIISYAAYLRVIGKDQEALKYYEVLSERYPDNEAYKDEIANLKAKIK